MDLALPTEGLSRYTSASQRARIASESWAERELYCPRCTTDYLDPLPRNTPVVDFRCAGCSSEFQLKSSASAFGKRLTDGAHSQMRAAIVQNKTPNLLLLHYQLSEFHVLSLIFIPDFAFSLSALECRPPLAATARRAGGVGCNILLNQIQADAQIALVCHRRAIPADKVSRKFEKLRPLASLKPEMRGWTLDVLNVVRTLRKSEFTLGDVYAFERSLARLHPKNANIQPKIRQQLQVLRDYGFLVFLGDGSYRLL